MNEHLTKLYSEAASYAFDERFVPGAVKAIPDVIIEKFAELIAKECMTLCTKSYHTNDGWGVTNGDVRCHYAIAEHFGIEPTTSYRKE